MSDAYPSQQQEKFIVRLPDGMRDRIKLAADENKRSMNAEIIARLEASFQPRTPMTAEEGRHHRKMLERILVAAGYEKLLFDKASEAPLEKEEKPRAPLKRRINMKPKDK